jgi:hypothetical protein
VIDVRFVPSIDGPKADLIPRFPGKDSLICRVRLAPYGDGGKYGSQGVLAVPSNAKGARRLEAVLLDKTNQVSDIVSSTVDDDLG